MVIAILILLLSVASMLQPIIIDFFFDAFIYSSYLILVFIFFMIRKLLLKTFIPVSRIFNNEDDIFIFSRNFRKSSASREKKFFGMSRF